MGHDVVAGGDRIVLVTGAAAGIGRALAARFAKGDRVVVADIDGAAAKAVASELGLSDRVLPVTLDVSNPGSVADAFEIVHGAFGPVDVLCNNAGVMDGFAPAGEVTDEVWERVIGVNLTGPFLTTRAALPAMVDRGAGTIINIASIAALVGGRSGAAYAASKHGVLGLTRSVAWHYGQRGIRCNAICPGPVQTSIGVNRQDSPAGRARAEGVLATAMGTGEPNDIASVAVFLASDGARFVNGAVISADGGWSAG